MQHWFIHRCRNELDSSRSMENLWIVPKSALSVHDPLGLAVRVHRRVGTSTVVRFDDSRRDENEEADEDSEKIHLGKEKLLVVLVDPRKVLYSKVSDKPTAKSAKLYCKLQNARCKSIETGDR